MEIPVGNQTARPSEPIERSLEDSLIELYPV